MSDLTNARNALAARDQFAAVGVGYADREIAEHLRAALAEVERLTTEATILREGLAESQRVFALCLGREQERGDKAEAVAIQAYDLTQATADSPNTPSDWRRLSDALEGIGIEAILGRAARSKQ